MMMALVSLVIVMLARTEKIYNSTFKGCNSYLKLNRTGEGPHLERNWDWE